MKSSADVVVIGGGVMGCSILFNLAKRGVANAVLVERDILGAGSTGKSSGITCIFSLLLVSHGHSPREINTHLAYESQKIFRNFKDIVGADSGFKETGVMFLVASDLLEPFKNSISLQQSVGVHTRIISKEETADIAPYLKVDDASGMFYEAESGYGDPSSVGQGYAAGARGLGAEVSLGNAALDVEVKNGRVTAVMTVEGRIETDTAVIAAGPWTGRFMKKLGYDLPLTSTRHEVFLLKRPSGGLPGHPVVMDLVNGTYFRAESPDLTLAGDLVLDEEADPDDYIQKTSTDFVQTIWQRVATRLPALENAQLFNSYAGLYTNTPDGQAIVGRVEGVDGLYICTGFNGYGFKQSPAIGIVVSELVLDGKAKTIDITPLGMGRFHRRPQSQAG